jgi:hypothetical protein
MKLLTLSEGDLLKALTHATGAQYSRKSLLSMSADDIKTRADNGQDAGSRVSGFTSQATGVPIKPRHRKFLGVSTRQFSLSPPGL